MPQIEIIVHLQDQYWFYFRFACEDPRGLQLIPLVKQPEGLPPCPISLEQDDKVCMGQ